VAALQAVLRAARRDQPPRFDIALGEESVVGGTLAAAEEVGADSAALEQLKRTISAKVASGELPMLGVSVVKNGRQILCAGAGEASAGVALQPDSILRFYSMSKAVTTLTALIFMEEGKLALDDSISAHLSAWDDSIVTVIDTATPARRPITVRDLICHCSGLTYGFRSDPEAAAIATAYRTQRLELPHSITEHKDGFGVEPCASLREFAQRLNKIPLCAQPGSKFEYSASTDLLGALLEEVSGLDLDTLFQQRVFGPLKMSDTCVSRVRARSFHQISSI
jgi:CubicO group peptidase (beta-lactamase class C family)